MLLLLTLFCTPALANQPIPLSPDTKVQQDEAQSGSASGGESFMPTIGAFIIVTGTLALILWFLKKSQGNSGRRIPSSVVKTLGTTRIGTTPVFLVEVGKKLVLVSTSSNGLTPLTEIDNPAEVEAIRKALVNNGDQETPLSGNRTAQSEEKGGEK